MAWELVQYEDGKVEEVWREMPMPDTKELEKEYYATLAEESGPIASRIADSYAALVERAEKAEAEAARLQEENTRLTARLNLAGAALNRLSCLGNGGLPGNSDGNVIAQDAIAAIRRIL